MDVWQSYSDTAIRILVNLQKHGLVFVVQCNRETKIPEWIEVSDAYGYKQSLKLNLDIDPTLNLPTPVLEPKPNPTKLPPQVA